MKGKGTYGAQNGQDKSVGKSGKVAAGYDAAFVGYVNVNLSDEQKATFDKWADSASVWDVLTASVSDGINLSLRIEPKSGGYLASATQRREDSPNAGLVATARAREPLVALLRLLFILAYLGRAERWTDLQPVANPDRW